MKPRYLLYSICILLCVGFFTGNPCWAAKDKQESPELKELSIKEIDAMEEQANNARNLFHSGKYDEAAKIFETLTTDLTVSKPLYLCELGTCYIAMNDWSKAKDVLLQAAEMSEGFFDVRSEKKAIGLFGSESKKIFKGDPHEKASLYMFLGLAFLRDNDVDNALACFKNGILSDSDVTNEMYKSDFGLLYALEAKCHKLRNQEDMFEQSKRVACDSFCLTHPQLKSMVAEKQTLMEKKPKDENPVDFATVDEKINEAREKLPLDYIAPLVNADYNTLLLVFSGRCPIKSRAGQYGEKTYLVLNPPYANRYEASINSEECYYVDAIQGMSDISFQATTKGGRLMDNVLANQAMFKGITSDIGDSFLDSVDDVSSPEAALVFLVVGLVAKGVSAAANPKADIRQWGTLPDTVQIIPLSLSEGQHEVVIDEYYNVLKTGEKKLKIDVEDPNRLQIITTVSNSTRTDL